MAANLASVFNKAVGERRRRPGILSNAPTVVIETGFNSPTGNGEHQQQQHHQQQQRPSPPPPPPPPPTPQTGEIADPFLHHHHHHYAKLLSPFDQDSMGNPKEPAVFFVPDDDAAVMPSDQLSRDEAAKMAGQNLYNRGYGHGLPPEGALLPPVAPSIAPSEQQVAAGLVESGVTLDLMGRGGKMTSVRRTFCLFVLFDLIMMFILWVIYTQLIGDTGYAAFDKQVLNYTFQTSLFDTVLVACFRFTCLLLFYALFRLRHWVVVAFTTGLSSAFLIIKIFLYDFDGTKSGSNPLSYCLIIISFVLAWVETWFLDFKVLPQELKMEKRMNMGARRGGYGSTTGGRFDGRYQRFTDDMQSVITEDREFYSPMGTPEGSDGEDDRDDSGGRGGSSKASSSTPPTTINSKTIEDNDYIRLARHCFEILWTYINSPEGDWKMETGTNAVEGVVHSKKIKGVGKVFRTKGEVEINANKLFMDISYKPEEMPTWNPTMKEARILQKIDDTMDVIYNVSSEVAGGVISSRDFISVRCMGERNGYLMGAGMAVNHPDMPPQKQYVRGVNGAGGFVFQPHPEDPENKCNFIWFMNTDIKGWFPQKLIDASMSKVGIDFLGFLRAHAVEVQQNGSGASSRQPS